MKKIFLLILSFCFFINSGFSRSSYKLNEYEIPISQLNEIEQQKVCELFNVLNLTWRKSSVFDSLYINTTYDRVEELQKVFSENNIYAPIYIEQTSNSSIFLDKNFNSLSLIQQTNDLGLTIQEALDDMNIPIFDDITPKIGILCDGVLTNDLNKFETVINYRNDFSSVGYVGNSGSIIYNIIREIIPNARISLYVVNSIEDIFQAFEDDGTFNEINDNTHIILKDMDIIINTLTFIGLGPEVAGSGESWLKNANLKKIVDENNLSVVQSVGDYGNTHFLLNYMDIDRNYTHDFYFGKNVLPFVLPPGKNIQIILLWEDRATAWTDGAIYDFNINVSEKKWNELGGWSYYQIIKKSSAKQNGNPGDIPYEIIQIENTNDYNTIYNLDIVSGNPISKDNRVLHLFFKPTSPMSIFNSNYLLNVDEMFEPEDITYIHNYSYSVPSLADISSFFTVGALNHNNQIRRYSSRGPVYYSTNATRPHLVALDGIYIDENYPNIQGTGVSTSFVTAIAAYYTKINPEKDFDDIKQIIMNNAEYLGNENIYGKGKLKFISDIPPTNTPIPTSTPTPTITLTPIPVFDIIKTYEFNEGNSLEECQWKEIPGGFYENNMPPQGIINMNESMINIIPSSKDMIGMNIKVKNNELVFIHSSSSVNIDVNPIIIRALIRVTNNNDLHISVGALEGNLNNGEDVDGSINFSTKISSDEFVNGEEYIYSIIYNKKKNKITPFIQVTTTTGDNLNSRSVYIDHIDIIDGSSLLNF